MVCTFTRATNALERRLNSTGLTLTQYRLMNFIYKNTTISKIDVDLFVSQSPNEKQVQLALAEIMGKGFVKVEKKNKSVSLTEQGATAINEVYNIHQASLNAPKVTLI